jgi:hypothetical protein
MVHHGLFQFKNSAYLQASPFHPTRAVHNILESVSEEILLLFPICQKKYYFYSPNIFKLN